MSLQNAQTGGHFLTVKARVYVCEGAVDFVTRWQPCVSILPFAAHI